MCVCVCVCGVHIPTVRLSCFLFHSVELAEIEDVPFICQFHSEIGLLSTSTEQNH